MIGLTSATHARLRQGRLSYAIPLGIPVCLVLLPQILARWQSQASFDLFLLSGMAILVVAAVGQQLLSGVAGQPSLGNAAFFAVGAYSLAILLARYHAPFWLALSLALAASAVTGMVVGLPALRMRGPYLAIATLALVFITQDFLGQYETQTLQASTLVLKRPAALVSDTSFYYLTLGVVLTVLILARNLLAGRAGRSLVALRESEAAAEMLGVPAGRTRMIVFVLSATCTGLAGALQALQQGSVASSSFGLDLSVLLLGTVVIGGLGNLAGAIVGGCFVAGLEDLLRYELPGTIGPIDVATASPIIYSLLIIGTIALFPAGISKAVPWGRATKIQS